MKKTKESIIKQINTKSLRSYLAMLILNEKFTKNELLKIYEAMLRTHIKI